jgi:branched-chain amino acid aminotransferase
MNLAAEDDIPTRTGRYRPERFREAEEMFLTNTTGEVWPVARLDDSRVGGGPVTERLAELFDHRVAQYY